MTNESIEEQITERILKEAKTKELSIAALTDDINRINRKVNALLLVLVSFFLGGLTFCILDVAFKFFRGFQI